MNDKNEAMSEQGMIFADQLEELQRLFCDMPAPDSDNLEWSHVESRLAEIEDEMSEAHRDHAFEYWWDKIPERVGMTWKESHQAAFNRAHSIYCHTPRIIIERPAVCGWYIMFAIGVVCGMIIGFATFFLNVSPN